MSESTWGVLASVHDRNQALALRILKPGGSWNMEAIATQQKVRHLIQVHNLLILSKLGIHCGEPSVYLILDFLLEIILDLSVIILNSRGQHSG